MSRHLCFYNNDTLLQDNTEPGYFTEFNVPSDTNLIVCYDDDYKITGNIRVTGSSNQDMIYFQFAADSAIFLLSSIQNYTQNQTVRAQITVSNIAKDSSNLSQDIQTYLQNCGVGSGSSIDFSTIVTALNSIATALSALTNLSNLSNLTQLANIITAIQNKDNQNDIVSILTDVFISKNNSGSIKKSVFKSYNNLSSYNDDVINFGTFYNEIHRILSCLTNLTSVSSNINEISVSNRPLVGLMSLSSNFSSPSNVLNNSHLKVISSVLNNIETKLEQNLPFTTLAQVDVVTDYTQVVKGVGKNE